MIERVEFNFENGITMYFDENGNELDTETAKQLIAEREQFLAELAVNPPVDDPSEGINDPN